MKISYDLHIHTALSPCAENDMTPGNIVGMAYLNGLDLIAITDHQSSANVRSALAAADFLRLEKKAAPVILAGLEIECAEGFHLLAYFPDPGSADSFAAFLDGHRFMIPNRPEIFGQQYLFDNNDEIIGTLPDLLLTAVDLSSARIEQSVWSAGGYMVPAHIDRSSYSMLESLGCIPEEFTGKILELSKLCDQALFAKRHPELSSYKFLVNSDAHRLIDIMDPGSTLELPQIDPDVFDAAHVISALREKSFK